MFSLAVLALPLTASPEESHIAAANDLLNVLRFEQTTNHTINMMIDLQIQSDPSMQDYADVFRDFFAKYMNISDLKKEVVLIYADCFTEDELKGLIAFYGTELGQKCLEKLPEAMERGAIIGQTEVYKNLPELEKMLEAKKALLESEELS